MLFPLTIETFCDSAVYMFSSKEQILYTSTQVYDVKFVSSNRHTLHVDYANHVRQLYTFFNV